MLMESIEAKAMGATKRRTPLQAIRAKCVWCCGGQPREATSCPAGKCPLHSWRHGRKPEGAINSALQTIREKCLQDCGEQGSHKDVTECPIIDCPLMPFRFGKNPNISEETRQKHRVRMMLR
jgi:hypothetical protein